jgi:acyl-CoA synthetase (AMP-forming)/AMP-acid ligase II
MKASDIPEVGFIPLETGLPGEIIVSGPQITPAYFEMPVETAKAKMIIQGKLWHRMGDVGYLDDDHQLWFLGRKTHQVVVDKNTIHYPIRIEAIFNQHPAIKRTALIKLTKNQVIFPALVIERKDGQTKMTAEFNKELLALAQTSPYTSQIDQFFLYPAFPVDVRHNIKIDRIKLSDWAQKKLS